MWYTRPDGSTGDSMTDIGALALIDGDYDCAEHVRACQRPDGSFFRHPTMPNSDYSRDHIVSLCNYTFWSKDREPLSKFLKYILKNKGRFCQGTVGQSMINPIILSTVLSVLGYKIVPFLLDLLNWPVLLLEAKFTKIGYRLILISEVALLKSMNSKYPAVWKFIIEACRKREPENLWYKALTGKASYDEVVGYKNSFPSDKLGGEWHWNEVGRKATGVDLQYLVSLTRRLNNEGFFGRSKCVVSGRMREFLCL